MIHGIWTGPRLVATTVVAVIALGACQREERIATAQSDATSGTSSSTSPTTGSGAPTVSTSGTGTGTALTAPLPAEEASFITKAAEGSQFEVEVAKLAADKASSPEVKAFAEMLVADHMAATDKLRQIATGHNLALPASLPDAKKKELEQLAQLSGVEFERRFVQMAGIQDHQHDITQFEKASQDARSEDVKQFAQATLPTLRKHLAAAQKLPGATRAKG